jgi:hypothetical protein
MQSTQKQVTSAVTPARTLRDAARYLERHGWIQGAYYDLASTAFTPSACMVGALAFVCYDGPVDCPMFLFDVPGFDGPGRLRRRPRFGVYGVRLQRRQRPHRFGGHRHVAGCR